MKKLSLIIISLSLSFLFACNNCETTNESVSEKQSVEVDANSGATGLGIVKSELSSVDALDSVYSFLKTCPEYYFTTVQNDRPRVCPIGIVLKYDQKLWFHVGKHKASYSHIQANPNVEIAATSSSGEWIRISGKAVCKDDSTINKMTFDLAPGLKNMYNDSTGRVLGHFYISNASAEISQNDGKVYYFSF